MTVATQSNEDACRLGFDGEMTIYSAAELKDALLDGLNRCGQLEINLSQVSEMDSAGLQLFYLLKREAAHQNKQVSLVAHSRATLEDALLHLVGAADDREAVSAILAAERSMRKAGHENRTEAMGSR